MRLMIAGFAAASLLAAFHPSSATAQTAGPEPTKELYDQIHKADADLFHAIFDLCDTKALGEMVTDDVEFIHDKWGMTSNTKAQLVGSFEKTCARQKTGEDYRARRELVEGSMTVHPLKGYGAMQMGEHRFYKLTPGKPEELVEVGKFIDIWKQVDGRWKLYRVISYDHRLTK